MKFLEQYDFSKEEIDEFINSTPKKIMDSIKKHKALVKNNLSYIKSIGANTYREIFTNYPDLFFMDPSQFKKMFDKYDKESLIQKLNENYKVVEYL